MQNRKYNVILYFIASVIAITLAIQVYWNYKNYQAGKRQLINEVQISLDNAVDAYYTQLAQRNTMALVVNDDKKDTFENKVTKLFKKLNFSKTGITGLDSINPEEGSKISIFRGLKADSLADAQNKKGNFISGSSFISNNDSLKKILSVVDSLNNVPQEKRRFISASEMLSDPSILKTFTSKVVVSITEDSIQTQRLDSLLQNELQRKELNVEYGFRFTGKDSIVQEINPPVLKAKNLKTTANSSLLPKQSTLALYFTNVTTTILKRNLVGILLSTLLIAAVIACLLFLLSIINRQKQLAELKNDLIGNITHEFKTPIATIHVALEGITNFNTENDPKKTKNYVQTSNFQLEKLNTMVEKLLETATLDGNSLRLKREEIDVIQLLENLIAKHQYLAPQKNFIMEKSSESLALFADAFHLENALNNIFDNAVKYGGNHIKTALKVKNRAILIQIEDNGTDLTATQSRQVFEKFYRVPQGNTHDVKGFGIGLYYTKKIIEKHGGTITVETNGKTTFIITLPHA